MTNLESRNGRVLAEKLRLVVSDTVQEWTGTISEAANSSLSENDEKALITLLRQRVEVFVKSCN